MELQEEFRKIQPLTFDGEKEEDGEAWILMTKYFHVYEYERNLKARLVIYELQGKVTLWWEKFKSVQTLDEKATSWEEFQMQFKSRYLNEQYYDDIEKDFHEIILGQLTMDEFVAKFINLLW